MSGQENPRPHDDRAANAEMVNRAMTDDEWEEGMRKAFEGEPDEQGSALVWAAGILGLVALIALGVVAWGWRP